MSRPRSIRRLGGAAIVLFLVLVLLVGAWVRADRRAERAADAEAAVARVVDDRTVAGLVQDERAIVAEGGNASAAEQITDLALTRANLPAVGVSLASAREAVALDTDTAIAQYNEIIASLLARSTDADLGLDLGSSETVQLLRAGGAYAPLREALATEGATAATGSGSQLAAAILSTNDWVETAQARTPAAYGPELQQIVAIDALDELRDLGAATNDGDTGAAGELALAVEQKMDAISVLQRTVHQRLQTELAAASASEARAKLRNPAALLGAILLFAGIAGAIARRALRPARLLTFDAAPILDGEFDSLVDEVERGVQVAPTIAPLQTDSEALAPVVEALNVSQRAAIDQAAGRADSRNQLLDTVATAGLKAERMFAEQRALLAEFEPRVNDLDDVLFLERMRGILSGLAKTNDHLLVLSEADGLPVPIVGASPMTAVLAAGQQSSRTPRRVQLAVGQDAAVPNELARDLTKVVRDLLDNALAFSPPHTTVTLQGDGIDGVYVIWITDEGIGLDPDVCAELNFELAHPRPVDEIGASGVGIAVVSRLAERHGLDVQLVTEESTGVQARVSVPTESLISVSDALELDVSPADLLDGPEPTATEPEPEADLTDDLLADAGSGLANLANRARMAEAAAAFEPAEPETPLADPFDVDLPSGGSADDAALIEAAAAEFGPAVVPSIEADHIEAGHMDVFDDLGFDDPDHADFPDHTGRSVDLVDLVSSQHDDDPDDVFWNPIEPGPDTSTLDLDLDLFEDIEMSTAPTRQPDAAAEAPVADAVPVPTVLGADGEPEQCVELPLSARIAAAEARPSLATLADRLRK